MAVRIVTDSTTTLLQEEIERYKLKIVTLFLVSDGVAEPEVGMDIDAFYARLHDLDALPTSAQPTPASFYEAFTEVLDAGDDVLGIFTASGLSGTYEGARMIAAQIERERPEVAGRIAIVDSTSNSRSLSYPVLEAGRLALEGASLDTCTEAAKYTAACTRFVFTPLTLEYLRRGGRIGRASALLGALLKLNPVLGPDKHDGTVHTYAKVRTFPRALDTIKDIMLEDAAGSGGLKALCVHYIVEREAAEKYAETVVQPLTDLDILVAPVPAVIGSHVGPAVGIAYVTNEPVQKESK
jgi:DegV family protein with EDD domain